MAGPEVDNDWQVLHRRVALGKALGPDEQVAYEAGCRALDAEEQLDGDLARLRQLKTRIAVEKAERQRLRQREAELEERSPRWKRDLTSEPASYSVSVIEGVLGSVQADAALGLFSVPKAIQKTVPVR